MGEEPSRRRFVRASAGVVMVGSLAGCLDSVTGGGSSGNGNEEEEDEDKSSPEGGTVTPTATPTETPYQGDTTEFTLNVTGGSGREYEEFESLTVSFESVTLKPATDDGSPVTLDAGGKSVDLVKIAGDSSATLLDAVATPTGKYDTIELDTTVESATLSDGSSATVKGDTLSDSLVLFDEPATFTTDSEVILSLFLAISGEGPYELEISGWGGTGF